ncbi:MAG: DNA repair protein RecO [Suipraeoptans sp.]
MNDITVTGMILSSGPIGEYDRRVVLLTRERGRISAFAKGARKPNSVMVGQTSPFVYAEFKLYEGRNSYTINGISVLNYFEELRRDMEGVYYGIYFADLANYYTREGNDESQTLLLLYQTLKALQNDKLSNRLIRCVYELKLVTIQGEGPQVFKCVVSQEEMKDNACFSVDTGGVICTSIRNKISDAIPISNSTLYTLQYIMSSKLSKLYNFAVKSSVLSELELICRRYLKHHMNRELKSRNILETMIK